eukprot:EG_transcript_20607
MNVPPPRVFGPPPAPPRRKDELPSRAPYEFSTEENAILETVVRASRPLSYVFVLFAMTQAVKLLAFSLREPLPGWLLFTCSVHLLVYGSVAVCLRAAAHSFSRVIHEEGDDVQHLLRGLSSLAKALKKGIVPITLLACSQLGRSAVELAEHLPGPGRSRPAPAVLAHLLPKAAAGTRPRGRFRRRVPSHDPA